MSAVPYLLALIVVAIVAPKVARIIIGVVLGCAALLYGFAVLS